MGVSNTFDGGFKGKTWKNPRKTIGNLFVYGYLWMFPRKMVFSMCD